MGNDIDERIVRMRFDNKQFEDNVQTSLSTLDKLKQALKLDGAAKGLEEVDEAAKQPNLSGLSGTVDTIRDRFSALEVIAVTALANITNSVINTGRQMLHSLAIEPITQGFEEYELKMGSIQTIMLGSGESLETVNKYLNELNIYADKTIYSFSDMTSNIGKFINAGVGLKDSVKAIQGISNVAAISGANTADASRAMYNFAQALSSGSVKLIDWKSIETANMATVEFKNELLKTALSLGTVEKKGEKYVTTTTNAQGKVSDAFDATSQFNDSLNHQWMTTEVLVQTLNKYSDETTEIGKKAFAAAQDVKTFTQLMDTLKEAVGSGWATTWEIIFGDFEQAKSLWTSISNVVGGFIDAQSDARNATMQTWKDLGGRTALIDTFKNAFSGLSQILNIVKDAFDKVFPTPTATKMVVIAERLKDLTEKFKMSDETAQNLRNTFKGLFAVIDIVWQAFKTLAVNILPVTGLVGNLSEKILGFTGPLGLMLTASPKYSRSVICSSYTPGDVSTVSP